jgi:hypothetical protein
MNTLGKEYRQIGGDYKVVHHTEYLESLVAAGRLKAGLGNSSSGSRSSEARVTYHDPCYLGRHNGVYDAPRNLLNVLSNAVVELPRARENSFCCGAGGAQFWKEEEPGTERISDNRYREAVLALDGAAEKVLAVGCPFCKSMLQSTPGRNEDGIAVRDVAELLLESVQENISVNGAGPTLETVVPAVQTQSEAASKRAAPLLVEQAIVPVLQRPVPAQQAAPVKQATPSQRKKWEPKAVAITRGDPSLPLSHEAVEPSPAPIAPPESSPLPEDVDGPKRKRWNPTAKKPTDAVDGDKNCEEQSE